MITNTPGRTFLFQSIVIGTETWLNNGHIDAEMFPADTPDKLRYQLVRRDREKHAGGVIIFSKPGLMCTRETDLETNCEIIWTKLKLARDKSALIGSYYRPPTIDSLDQLQESILRARTFSTLTNMALEQTDLVKLYYWWPRMTSLKPSTTTNKSTWPS